jgi:hypothetical protein
MFVDLKSDCLNQTFKNQAQPLILTERMKTVTASVVRNKKGENKNTTVGNNHPS